MAIDNVRKYIKEKAEEFGARADNVYNKPYVERNNTDKMLSKIMVHTLDSFIQRRKFPDHSTIFR